MKVITFDHTHPDYEILTEIFLTLPQDINHRHSDGETIPALMASLQREMDPAHPFLKHGIRKYILIQDNEEFVARASLMIDHLLIPQGQRKIGYIAHFDCIPSASLMEALLKTVEKTLQMHGIHEVHGPIQGTVFQKYRFQITGQDQPAFVGEPRNPFSLVEFFQQQGYQIHRKWNSFDLVRTQVEALMNAAAMAVEQKEKQNAAEKKIQILPVELTHFEQEVINLFPVVMKIFEGNYGFVPISFAEFMLNFSALKMLIVPGGLVKAINEKGECIGFAYGYPNNLSFVAHTIGILPQYRGGVGPYKLAAAIWSHALHLPQNFQHFIGALVIDGHSFFDKIKAPTRTYGVFKKILD